MMTIKFTTNDTDAKTILAFLRENGIKAEIIDGMESKLDSITLTSTPTLTATPKKQSIKFSLPTVEPDEANGCIARWGKSICWWYGEKTFMPDKVKYAIKMSARECGASWNAETHLYEFKTVKEAKAWFKTQAARSSK